MSKFTFEEISEVMADDRINGKQVNIDEYGFSREFEFTIDDNSYRIFWFHNHSTLCVGSLVVCFHRALLANTWPMCGTKMQLHFRDIDDKVVAVLPIEWIPKEQSK